MLRRHLLLALIPLGLPLPSHANDPVEFGRAAAAQWLPLVDAADAEASWNITAGGFRRAITLAQWSHVLSTTRWPLGAVKSRQEVEARSVTSLPGAPDGQYVLIRYQLVFEHKADATEALTIVLDADGTWRITGYFIR